MKNRMTKNDYDDQKRELKRGLENDLKKSDVK
jgi:hypothetical protein